MGCPVCLNKLYFAMVCYDHKRDTLEQKSGLKLKGFEEFVTDDEEDEDAEEEACVKCGDEDDEKCCGHKGQAKGKVKGRRRRSLNLHSRYEELAEWFKLHKCYREATWYRSRLD